MKALVTYFMFGNGTYFKAIGRSRRETESIFSRYFSKKEVQKRGGAKRREGWFEVGSAVIGDYSGKEKKWTTG